MNNLTRSALRRHVSIIQTMPSHKPSKKSLTDVNDRTHRAFEYETGREANQRIVGSFVGEDWIFISLAPSLQILHLLYLSSLNLEFLIKLVNSPQVETECRLGVCGFSINRRASGQFT